MMKRIVGVLVVMVVVFTALAALSQMEQAQPVYTYVSQFQIPRANWTQFAEDTDKTTIPTMKRLMADGTIVWLVDL
jgi:hypothetical protein